MKLPMNLACAVVALLLAVWPAAGQEQEQTPRTNHVAEVYRQLFQERLKNIERLRQYHEQGVFPRNYDFPTRVPYFVDAHGTHCAMAHLVKESGAVDVVRQVVKLNNQIYVKDVKSGSFLEWMLRSGLLLEECARIQPVYRPTPPTYPVYPYPYPPGGFPNPPNQPNYPIGPPYPIYPPVVSPSPIYPTFPINPPVGSLKPIYTPNPDDKRIKDYLAGVEAELMANTFQSLPKVMDVWRARNKDLFLGKSSAVVAPPAVKTTKATLTLKNLSRSQQVEVMLTFFDGAGQIVKQELPKFRASSNFHVAMLAVSQEIQVPYSCDNTWVVVEWTAGPGLNITVPFQTVADVKPLVQARK